jgi:hypothetical protein
MTKFVVFVKVVTVKMAMYTISRPEVYYPINRLGIQFSVLYTPNS